MPGRLSVSPGVAERACLIASGEPYEKSSDLLKRLTGIELSPTCIEDIAKRLGQILRKDEAQKAQADSEMSAEMPCALVASKKKPPRAKLFYLQADGSMLNTEEGWKENKLAMFFCEDDLRRSGEGEKQRISITKKDFTSNLAEGVGKFKSLVRQMMKRTGNLSLNDEIVFLSDGAQWLMNMACEIKSLFPKVTHILDWFHVCENLWKCAHALWGESSPEAKSWVKKYKKIIWEGDIQRALSMLLQEANGAKKQTPLRELYSYFHTRKGSMRYKEFREKGYYIGSGAIESANSYAIQARLKKAGMKWSVGGANAVAHLRIRYLADRWDDIWDKGSPIFLRAA